MKQTKISLLAMTLSLLSVQHLFAAPSESFKYIKAPVTDTAQNNKQNTRIVIQFSHTYDEDKLVKQATSAKSRSDRLKKIEAKYMARMSNIQFKVIQVAVGSDITVGDFAPYALGGRVITFNQHLAPETVAKIISRLKKVPGVRNVEEDLPIQATSANLTEVNPYQYSMYDQVVSPVYGFMTYGSHFFDSSSKHFIPYRGKGVTVAVLDTGYVPHPNFLSQLLPQDGQNHYGYTFISDCTLLGECPGNTPEDQRYVAPRPDALEAIGNGVWHGTGVMGIVAGQNNPVNSTIAPYGGVLGGAPEANLVPVRVLGIGGSWNSDVVGGMLWAAGLHPTILNPHPAQVLNLSMAGVGQCPTVYKDVIKQLTDANVAIVVAGGNNNSNAIANTYPADCPGVISVAALAGVNAPATYTSTGYATIAAPGGGGDWFFSNATPVIVPYYGPVSSSMTHKYSACTGNDCFTYTGSAGTSQAAPLVAAAIADMLSAKPGLTTAQIIEILQQTADPLDNLCSTYNGGKHCINAKKLNAARAVDMASKISY